MYLYIYFIKVFLIKNSIPGERVWLRENMSFPHFKMSFTAVQKRLLTWIAS